jgi:hypothetical protein
MDDSAFYHPRFLRDAVLEIAEVGAWSVRSMVVKGAILWIVWSVEVSMIFVMTLLTAVSVASSRLYCERCLRWCGARAKIVRLAASPDPSELARRVGAYDLGALEALPDPAPDAARWIEVDLESCEGCSHTNALTVSRVAIGRDKKGNEKRDVDSLLHRLVVSSDEAARVRALATRGGDAAAVATT